MVVRESPTVEYEESVTPTFLKTVSAYANYGRARLSLALMTRVWLSALQIRSQSVSASRT